MGSLQLGYRRTLAHVSSDFPGWQQPVSALQTMTVWSQDGWVSVGGCREPWYLHVFAAIQGFQVVRDFYGII